MDISETTQPKSDQQNFDDYAAGSKTLTISEVRAGTSEQPVEIHVQEFPGRPYKPSKSMRRVLVQAWGSEASTYTGRRMTLYGDPTVKFGAATVGGIKISHLSHIDKAVSVNLTVTRGKRAPFVVQPLPNTTATPDGGAVGAALDDIERASSMGELKTAWDLAAERGVQRHPDVVAAKDAKKHELGGTAS